MTAARQPAPAATKLVAAADASTAQTRMWLLDRMLPVGSSYHVNRAVDLRGPLDAPALAEALHRCVRRHEALRTRFELRGTRLRQIITSREPRLRMVDLRGLPAADRLADDLVRAAAADPFDLRTAPLLRALLLRPADEHHVLVLVLHHIVVDAWSLDQVVREIAADYRALVAGEPGEPPAPRLQQADHAAWERRALDAGRMDVHLDYWLRQTADLPALDLFTDRPPPPVPTRRGGLHHFALDPGLLGALDELARREGASRYMVLLAAFNVLLYRWTGRDDVVVGGTSPGRHRPELQDTVGFFVNMLVLRTRLDGRPTLREALRRTAATCQDAYDHQDAPFERLVELRGGARDPQRHPFFQVVFQMINMTTELELPGLAAAFRPPEPAPAMFDLVFTIEPAGGYVEYATDRYDEASVAALAAGWIAVLRELAADPDRPIEGTPGPVPVPRPAAAGPATAQAPQQAAGPLEEEVAAMWAEVLGRESIGRDDNFFQLGGHSLLATVLLTLLHERFGVELRLDGFFADPTVAGTAAAVEARRAAAVTVDDALSQLLEDLA
ncbi:condensation domain-containing protein [Dactylosporangium salmoneum]|uniref:Carrier domain-containing protein n=1 Tax=Dactylosporangium salmoneum TaxID=53361 RepID=A0ABP5TVA8_9ACTN